MLDAHIEYAENTNNFANVGNFTDIKSRILELEKEIETDNKNLAEMTKLLQEVGLKNEKLKKQLAESVPKKEVLKVLLKSQTFFEEQGPYVLVDNFEKLLTPPVKEE